MTTAKTYPMLQRDATEQKPFYSVCYQWERVPWTLYSHNRYGDSGRTQYGTSSFEVAKAEANKLVTQPGIAFAQVSMTKDCYNHSTVYETRKSNRVA